MARKDTRILFDLLTHTGASDVSVASANRLAKRLAEPLQSDPNLRRAWSALRHSYPDDENAPGPGLQDPIIKGAMDILANHLSRYPEQLSIAVAEPADPVLAALHSMEQRLTAQFQEQIGALQQEVRALRAEVAALRPDAPELDMGAPSTRMTARKRVKTPPLTREQGSQAQPEVFSIEHRQEDSKESFDWGSLPHPGEEADVRGERKDRRR